jgi:hypothetical protein
MQLPTPIPGLPARAAVEARELANELALDGEVVAWFALALDRGERISDAALREKLLDAAEASVRERGRARRIWRGEARIHWCAGGLDLKSALAVARAVEEAIRARRVEHEREPHSATASVGVAVSRPGISFEALAGVAEEGLTVARAGGGNRAAHTDLYDSVQRRVGGEPLAARAATQTAAPVTPGIEAAARIDRAATPVAETRGERVREPVADPRDDRVPSVGALAYGLRSVQRATESTASPAGERDGRVELLERRIAKLILALSQAESRISMLEREQGREGIASIYREVQGLDPGAPAFDTKRRIMARIFEANLALQAKYAS